MMRTDVTLAPARPVAVSARAVIDYDFPTALGSPPRQRFVLWLMGILVAAGALALAVARIDIAVSTKGKIVTSDSQIVIQPLETSVVRSVKVKPGDKVDAGQVLATLDPTFSAADVAELTAKLDLLRAACDRLEAETENRPYDPPSPTGEQRIEHRIYDKRQAEYLANVTASQSKMDTYQAELAADKTQVDDLSQQIILATQQDQIYETLVARDLASKLKLIDAQQRLVDAKSRLDTNLGEQQKLQQQIAQAAAERDAYSHEWQRKTSEELAQKRSERDEASAKLSKAVLRRKLSTLRAPAAATVLQVADRPAGSVVREAETLIQLVPTDAPLVAELDVDPRDIARLRVGDQVTVKLDSLPWQQFGVAHGVIRSLTPDVLADDNTRVAATDGSKAALKGDPRPAPIHYTARIELAEMSFRNLPADFMLRPGMRVTGDIKVGRRSVLEYILNPLTRVFNESLREP